MRQLESVLANIFYKNEKGKQIRIKELVFVTSEPKYDLHEGNLMKTKRIEECRFAVTDENFKTLVAVLTEMEKATEKDFEK